MKFLKLFSLVYVLTFFGCPEDDTINESMEDPEVEVNVLDFIYTPQTETTPERLVYNIELINISNVDVQGGVEITTSADGLIATTIPTSNSQCYQIPANSTCVYSFDETGILEILAPNSVVFMSAEYVFF